MIWLVVIDNSKLMHPAACFGGERRLGNWAETNLHSWFMHSFCNSATYLKKCFTQIKHQLIILCGDCPESHQEVLDDWKHLCIRRQKRKKFLIQIGRLEKKLKHKNIPEDRYLLNEPTLIYSVHTKALLEGLLSLLLDGIPRPPVMHIWKIFTRLWFRKDSLVSPSQLFLSCHPILLLNKWLLTFKPHSFPILANHRALLFYFLQLLHAKLSFHML